MYEQERRRRDALEDQGLDMKVGAAETAIAGLCLGRAALEASLSKVIVDALYEGRTLW